MHVFKCGAILVATSLLHTACATTSVQEAATKSSALRDTHERLNGALFMQTAAEYEILCRVAYAQARGALAAALADQSWTAAVEQTGSYQGLPTAVVLDLDETVLDNSRFQGRLVNDRSGYDDAAWTSWTKLHAAVEVPGARDFLEYAAAKGVTLFYITNRPSTQEADTRATLEGLPVVLPSTPDTVLTRGEKVAGPRRTRPHGARSWPMTTESSFSSETTSATS
ncbi:MAG: hypothetical protein IPL90_11095 [Holophagales bacterium]|nr:hypothetical protein [Holophagales bacterium]